MADAPARYFPVKAEPLRMQPGLFRLGTDFGNGVVDQRAFPVDAEREHYLREKQRVLHAHPERAGRADLTELELASLATVERRLREVLAREQHPAATGVELDGVARGLAEDLVIVRADDAGDRALFVHVCFPSGWRPERIVGQSFLGIHARIPGFDAVARSASSLVDAMITRGPYVRFVWTISADATLDHHPEHGARAAWTTATRRGYLRVERQTTLPVPEADAAIFAIRTYLYAFEELSSVERGTLAVALEQLPAPIRAYKGLDGALPRALELLGQ